MTNEQKEDILNKIRKIHGIAMPEKDPAFAILTGMEFIVKRYLKEVELLMSKQAVEYETTTVRYLDKAKELAEVKINAAVEDVYQDLHNLKINTIKEVQEVKPKPQDVPDIYWYLLSICTISAIGISFAIAMLIFT